jgi:hypothetical protein
MQARFGTALQMGSLWNRFREAKTARACAQSCTCSFLGTLSESLVSWYCSSFGRLRCVTSIYLSVANPWDISVKFFPSTLLEPIDTLEGGPSCRPCDSHGPLFQVRPSNIPDLTWSNCGGHPDSPPGPPGPTRTRRAQAAHWQAWAQWVVRSGQVRSGQVTHLQVRPDPAQCLGSLSPGWVCQCQ